MSGVGSGGTAGPGNGSPSRRNRVSFGRLYPQHRADLEDEYPQLREWRFFDQLEAYMVICEPENEARHIGGFTWFQDTPEDMEPRLRIYFTYSEGQIALQAVDPLL